MVNSPEENIGDIDLALEQEGYKQTLTSRHVQMIAFGGAIGVGLFMGTSRRLELAGPGLIFSFAFAGIVAYFLMRALGELVLYRQTSGSFVSYTREFFGPKAAYAVGWMYWLNWATTGIAELTAIGGYVTYWFPNLPKWIPALISLLVVLGVNLLSARAFGELEFIASFLKVFAIVSFLVIGIALVALSVHIGGDYQSKVSNLWSNGGLFPTGWSAPILILNSVIFSYAAIEMVGVAAGEMEDARKEVPKAVKAVIFRIAVFYVGSITLLCMVLPWTAYSADESPFTTVFKNLGVSGIGSIMQIILIIAAISSCNSGLYSTGRILRNLGQAKQAPQFTVKISKTGVPLGGILLTTSVYIIGVILNYCVPEYAFEIALSVASVAILCTWFSIFACQLKFRSLVNKGKLEASIYPAPGYPYTSIFSLIFLVFILISVTFGDKPDSYSLLVALVAGVFLSIGWYFIQKNNRNSQA